MFGSLKSYVALQMFKDFCEEIDDKITYVRMSAGKNEVTALKRPKIHFDVETTNSDVKWRKIP